ncbi:MAG: DUF6624 domain-containing protein [Cyclobacteriaceae bacterium]
MLLAPTVNYDSLKVVLEEIRRTDQHARRVLLDSVGLDSPYASLYIEKLNQVDARNLKEVSAILEKYGWIGRSQIGELAADAIFLVIQHSDLETMQKWLPAFKEQVSMNEASGLNFALAYDRFLMWSGKRQMYGTQASTSVRANNELVIWPIEDVGNVNARRKEIGLIDTIEDYARGLGARYDPEEKLPVKH